MNDSNTNEFADAPTIEIVDLTAPGPKPPEAPTMDLRPRAAAEEAKPLAALWLDNALGMLRSSMRAFEPAPPADIRIDIARETVRRHFHTDRRAPALSEPSAIKLVHQNFQTMRRFLYASESIFFPADDETAARNTRGYFGSGLIVAAYAYTQKSISFTRDFLTLGPKCKAAVIIHQLAHFIDARMRDQSCGGIMYDIADFETSLFNVHCYPNFAVNATPPYMDERYGMTRPED